MSILGFLSGPLKGLIDGVGSIIDNVHTSGEEKAAAKAKLLQIQNAFSTKVLEFETVLVQEQSKIIVAEAKGDSWMQRNWRPLIMLNFGFVVLYATIGPAFGAPVVDMTGVPTAMWSLLTVGIGGYIGGRTLEKITKTKNGG